MPGAVLESLTEGINSITQTLAILSIEHQKGYDDPRELVKDLVTQGLVRILARRTPMGYVGPMALSGKYFAGGLIQTEEGLRPSKQFSEHYRVARAKYLKRLPQATSDHRPKQTGRKCPVSDLDGGIDALCKVFVPLNTEVSKHYT